MSAKIGRNDPCHCGSGLKYKKCCCAKDEAARSAELSAQAAQAAREAAAKAEAQQEQEPRAAAKTGKSAGKREGAAGAKVPRPKLPSPHSMGLPRRGAI